MQTLSMKSKEICKLEESFKSNFNKVLLTSTEGVNYSYGQVWLNALILSNNWYEKSLKEGDRIVFLRSNDLSLLVSYLACAIGGFVAIPINPYSNKKLQKNYIELYKPSLIITETSDLMQTDVKRKNLEIEIKFSGEEDFLVINTSGTTGSPKGICHSLKNIIGSAISFSSLSGMNNDTAMYHILPMYYMAGILNTFFSPIMSGGRIIEGKMFSISTQFYFWKSCIKYNANFICLTPTIAMSLCHLAKDTKSAKSKVDNLVSIQSTAGVLLDGTRKKFYKTFGKPLQDCYGLTELGGPLTIQHYKDAVKQYDSGYISPSIKYILREDGVFLVNSPFLMKGYISKKGIESPVLNNSFFDTGDICEIKNKKLKIIGRSKDTIIRGSENIAPVVIENEISAFDFVAEVAVIGVKHDFWGEVILACVIFKKDTLVDEALTSLKSAKLTYTPDKYEVVNSFPRAAYGKINKFKLKEILSIN